MSVSAFISRKFFFALGIVVVLGFRVAADESKYPAADKYDQAMDLVLKDHKYEEAIPLLKAAVEAGNADAMVALGRMYVAGQGTLEEPMRGAALVKQAAELGHVEGQFLHGEFIANGIGEVYSLPKAYKSWRKAAEQGHHAAQFRVAQCYLEGITDLERDRPAAVKWLDKAAESDDPQLLSAIGQLFDDLRLDDIMDSKKAIALFKRAAAGGEPNAQYYLGEKYLEGTVVEKNLDEAAKLFDGAAKQGHVHAMQRLAEMSLTGEGMPKDPAHAYVVAAVAVARGNESAKEVMGKAAKELTPEQKKVADQQVQLELSR